MTAFCPFCLWNNKTFHSWFFLNLKKELYHETSTGELLRPKFVPYRIKINLWLKTGFGMSSSIPNKEPHPAAYCGGHYYRRPSWQRQLRNGSWWTRPSITILPPVLHGESITWDLARSHSLTRVIFSQGGKLRRVRTGGFTHKSDLRGKTRGFISSCAFYSHDNVNFDVRWSYWP